MVKEIRVVGLGVPCPNCGIRMDLVKETKCSSDYSYEKCPKCGYTDKLLPMSEKQFLELLEKIEEQIAGTHQFTGGQLDEIMEQVHDKIKEALKKNEQ